MIEIDEPMPPMEEPPIPTDELMELTEDPTELTEPQSEELTTDSTDTEPTKLTVTEPIEMESELPNSVIAMISSNNSTIDAVDSMKELMMKVIEQLMTMGGDGNDETDVTQIINLLKGISSQFELTISELQQMNLNMEVLQSNTMQSLEFQKQMLTNQLNSAEKFDLLVRALDNVNTNVMQAIR